MADTPAGAPPSYGGFWIRFLAYLVDSAILTLAAVVLLIGAAVAGEAAALLVTILCIAGPFLYFAGMQASARQATFGKALVGLKVTGADGGRLSFGRSLARELAKLISAFPLLIGFLLAAFTQKKQALHDMVAATLVERAAPGHVLAAIALVAAGVAAPFVAVTFLGAGILLAFMGGMMGGMGGEMTMTPAPMQTAKPAPRPPAPPPQAKTPAPAPQAKAPPPKPAAPAVEVTRTPPPPPVVAKVASPPPPPPPPVAKVDPVPPPPVAKTPPPPVAKAPPPPAQPKVASAPVRGAPAQPGPKFNDLMTAVLYRDAKAVDELLALGKWPDKPDSRGLTPLAVAVMLGDVASAESLLRAGANPEPALRAARDVSDPAMLRLLARYQR